MNLIKLGFFRVPQIIALLQIAESTLWLWVSKGEFPEPIKLGKRVAVWPITEVMEWIESKNNLRKINQ